MSPFAATAITAVVLFALGLLFIWNGSPLAAIARNFPRSERAAWFTIGVSTLWTLYHVTQLGESDFGNYKVLLAVGFVALGAGSIRYVPDFLAVRGACALTLLVGWVLIAATFMHYEAPAILLKVFVYLAIVLAFYLTVSPFRVRDFFQWLFARPRRPRILGALLGAYGLVLLGAAFTYT
jgi:hypothetical protein